MKITKTLQGMIDKGFSKQKSNIKEKYLSEVEQIQKALIEEVRNDSNYQFVQSIKEKLSEEYKELPNGVIRGYYDYLVRLDKLEDVFRKDLDSYIPYKDAIKELDKQKQQLMLELEYESDISKLNEILEKYNID